MRKILSFILVFIAAACGAQTAPIGVCISNVAQTISNGLIAPVPFASVTLCSQNSTSSNCAANIVSIYTTTALSAPTPTNPFTSDAGGNYFFCAPVGHYALMIAGSQGGFFVPDIALVDDWSKGGTVTGNWVVAGNVIAANLTAGALSGSTGHCAQIGSGGIITAAGLPCGTVTNVSIGTGWPSWFTPSITSPTTTPVINATVTAIPNSALTSPSITINSVTCTLGSSCSVNGGTPRTCNANGCYIILADGTIQQWGSVAGCGGGCATSVTFPVAFTTTSNLVVVTSCVNSPGNCMTSSQNFPSTTGFVFRQDAVVFVGGSGSGLPGSQAGNWFAVGN